TYEQRPGWVELRMSPPPLDGEPLPECIRSPRAERDPNGDEHRHQRPREVHPCGCGKDVRSAPGISPPSERRSGAPRRGWGDGSLAPAIRLEPLTNRLAHCCLCAFAVSRM